MIYLNIAFSLLLVVLVIYSAYLIYVRKDRILVRGYDDFLTIMLLLFLAMITFPITTSDSVITAFRNVMIYISLFSSFAIKRGVGAKGVYKVFFIVPWNQITSIYVESYSNNRVALKFVTKRGNWKLLFNFINVKKAIDICSSNVSDIKIHDRLIGKIK